MPLLDEHQIVSVDDHLVEHPRVWQDRLPAAMREAGPRIVEIDGMHIWNFDGDRFPTIGLKLQGQVIETTLFYTVQTLWNEDMKSIGVLVFMTTIMMPALELLALTYLLLPLRSGYAPAHFAIVFRMLQAVKPWGMVEVLMLGVLVSLVKLANLASVIPGIALWSFGALMFVMAAVAAVFDPRDLWSRVASARERAESGRSRAGDSTQMNGAR